MVFGVDHIVSGVAINIIALGVAGFLAEALFSALEGGGPTQSPSLPTSRRTIDLPFIADPMNTLEGKHWFLVSDLAAFVEMLTKNLSVAHAHRAGADLRQHLGAVAHPLRPAAAFLR